MKSEKVWKPLALPHRYTPYQPVGWEIRNKKEEIRVAEAVYQSDDWK